MNVLIFSPDLYHIYIVLDLQYSRKYDYQNICDELIALIKNHCNSNSVAEPVLFSFPEPCIYTFYSCNLIYLLEKHIENVHVISLAYILHKLGLVNLGIILQYEMVKIFQVMILDQQWKQFL